MVVFCLYTKYKRGWAEMHDDTKDCTFKSCDRSDESGFETTWCDIGSHCGNCL